MDDDTSRRPPSAHDQPPSQGRDFAGSVVMITGAAGGIGSRVAQEFGRAGARCCLVDIDGDGLDSTFEALDDPRNRHMSYTLDLRRIDQLAVLFDEAERQLGPVDHLVHAAAVFRRELDVDAIDEDEWDLMIDTNLKVPFFLLREAGRRLRRRRGTGSLTAFTSIGWQTGASGGMVPYCAAKGGVVTLVRGLATTYATDGIRVNAISPGSVDTEMMRDGLSSAELAAAAASIPLGRLAHPSELARAAVFLSSSDASYITGATLNVSGGALMY